MARAKALEWDVPRYGYAGAARKWVCSEQGKKHRASGDQRRQDQIICDDQGVELESNLKRSHMFHFDFLKDNSGGWRSGRQERKQGARLQSDCNSPRER